MSKTKLIAAFLGIGCFVAGIISVFVDSLAGAIFFGLCICGELIGSSIDYWPMLQNKDKTKE